MVGRTKITFESLSARDAHLKEWTQSSYSIDKKNPLVVWLKN